MRVGKRQRALLLATGRRKSAQNFCSFVSLVRSLGCETRGGGGERADVNGRKSLAQSHAITIS